MEDSSDDEISYSPASPQFGGKKLKLNDGSSQDSFKETVVSGRKDENVDSGVSADKSESTSSDDRGQTAQEGPSNEVVDAAPSGSNVRAILLNLRRPRWGRNYRKRKTPDRDTDSNGSSRDSDDLSADEASPSSRVDDAHSTSETESDDLRRLADFLSPETDSTCSGSSGSSSASDDHSYESDHILDLTGVSDGSDEELRMARQRPCTEEESRGKMPPVLLKTRPKHNYLLLREIINREMGLTFPCGKVAQEDFLFGRNFYGSLHAIYRMKKLHNLNKHRGCVNCINFHPEGKLLASGSDDTNVVIWDWARNAAVQTIKTGHKSNVFQSKFMFLDDSQLNIVTCARDGQVRLLQCHPGGGSTVSRRRLASHSRAAHKLHVSPEDPHVVISAGEDGLVMQCDVRAEHASRLFQVKERNTVIPLYSVCGNPRETCELIVAGRDKFVRMYDRRKSTKAMAYYCPTTFHQDTGTVKKKVRMSMMHLTCAVFNYDGSEILGSYNDEDIYLFDTKKDAFAEAFSDDIHERDGFTHQYSGHRNSATFKGVAFYGPKSEFVVSGSDCSYIYMWDKQTEAIVQWLRGDMNGVVNCVEPHPRCPVLASSGLDKDVKIWIPKGEEDPTYGGLERVVRENSVSQLRSPLFNDFLPTLYSAWRGENRLFTDDDDDSVAPLGGNIEFDGNVCTTF